MTRDVKSIHNKNQEFRTPVDSEVAGAAQFLGRKIRSKFKDFPANQVMFDEAIRTCSNAILRFAYYLHDTQDDLLTLQALVEDEKENSFSLTGEKQQQFKKISEIFECKKQIRPYRVSAPIPIPGKQPIDQYSDSFESSFVFIRADTPTTPSGFPPLAQQSCTQQGQPPYWKNLLKAVGL